MYDRLINFPDKIGDHLLEEKNNQLVKVVKEELLAENDSLKAANDDLLAEKDNIQAASMELIAEKDSLKAANNELRKEVRATENEKIMLKKSLAEAETARSRLEAELAGSVEQKLALQTRLASLGNEVRSAEENLREKQLEMERMDKHFTELLSEARSLLVEVRALAARCAHPGVNKKVQVQLSDLKDEPLEGGAEVVEDPLVKDTPLVPTNEKDTAVKATKVTEATVVMKSKGEGSSKKRPRRLVARGLPKVGDRVKMSSAGSDISCEVVEVRPGALKVLSCDWEKWVTFPNANIKSD